MARRARGSRPCRGPRTPGRGRSPSCKRASRSRRCGARARSSWDSGAARAGARGRCRGPGPRSRPRAPPRQRRRAGRGWYEGVERRDVLVVPIERMVVAGPVDLDPGEIAAQRDVGPAPARTTRVQTGRARSARVQAARVQVARAGRRHPAGRSTAVFRAWHNHQRRQGGQHPRRGLLLRVVRRPSGPSSSTGRARVDRL